MQRPTLLLADDSLTIQRVVNLTFADEGIDVVIAGDGDAALREIANSKPDIILADVHMPGPNGYEICSFLRSMEETADLPVILLVGSFEQFDKEEADRVGANAFVTKPFQSIRSLVEQVKELIAPPPAEEYVSERIEIPESRPSSPEVDTTDIDSLYNQSFAETVEMPPEMAAEMAAAAYAGDKLDDEMIETSYTAGDPDEPAAFASSTEAVEQKNFQGAETVEYNGPIMGPDHDNDAYDAPGLADAQVESVGQYEFESLHQEQPPESVPPGQPAESFEPPLSTGSLMAAPTEEFRRDPFASTVDEFDLDEIDLLDLSNSELKQPTKFVTPSEARSQGSNQQVVTLSPELLEMIVQKVVEKLSEKY